MKNILYPKRDQWSQILKRPTQTVKEIEATVNEVFEDVQTNGDSAIRKYTKQFDKVSLSSFLVTQDEIKTAVQSVSDELKEAIQMAAGNIEKFHSAQKTKTIYQETTPGVVCWQEKRPIQKVGLYIPGGTAPLFSTVLMLAIPAKIAGCQEIFLCSPPNKEGEIANEILYAASLCGVTNIYKVGGIQAISGLTFGTETIPKVYKIFGPGNQFVTVAKQLATKFGVAIDMPAGPSELLVMADESANASFIASDLLSQAEHGADSQVLLVSTSEKLIKEVSSEVDMQLKELPRVEITTKAIQNSKSILVKDFKEALALINEYAPEHFIVCTINNDFFIDSISNAGSVFIGNYTPESAGDYASGTNHTLPTNGYSKAYSGVNLDSFTKSITFQEITKTGIQNIGPSIELMAEAESLQAHKNAVTLRLKDLK
ncbi:histidinol dehydrogenase [Flavobacteriaceae bacterium]|nr:histidinol dehydrogenase [Flavobacteriaceae bacterium]MDC0870996.1 histidinol dehydrogenase [Flavobacteriaceae bacterium]